jgi:AraC family transcriptional regulator of adaptative response/methylated-DNA-[protein]-cysteine methyltransferase
MLCAMNGNTDSPARDYERIARAIGYLHENAAAQPGLAAAARHAGLSEHHFQRLFTRWAGVSPKRFLQCITLEDARRRLLASRNTLDLAADVGLSGGGRLHDLFVTLEAVSPGEARSGGAGIDIRWDLHDTPFGSALIGLTARGVCALHFVTDAEEGMARLCESWPRATLIRDQAATADIAQRIFTPLAGSRQPLAVLVKGSNFQVQVWRALLALPPGALTTYGDLATAIGRPGAARAVGTAVGANAIAWLIPCHRVIRSSGMLGGYRWGLPRKAAMLLREAAQAAEQNGQLKPLRT